MTSSIGSISFPVAQPDQVVSRAFKQVAKEVTEDGKTKQVLEAWVDFGGGTSQVSTLTITAGATGDDYIIEITAGAKNAIASYVQQAGDTANIIASRLLAELNGVPSISELVSGTVTNNVITLTADEPGINVTYDVSASTTAANLVVAETTSEAGTAKMRKIAEIKTFLEVPTGGRNLSIVSQTTFFDGANPPNEVRKNPETRVNHPQSMEAIAKLVNT